MASAQRVDGRESSTLRAPSPQTAPLPPAPADSRWRRATGWLWGYDFFVSYHWASGGTYAVALAERLRDRGYDCFLDRAEFAMGDDWKAEAERALRHTQRLVLIATPEAVAESGPVAREIEIFTARSRHVVPIVFGPGFTDADRERYPLLKRIPASQLYVSELPENRGVEPSEVVLGELVRTHKVLRRRALRRRIMAYAVTVLAAALVVACVFGVWAKLERDTAKQTLRHMAVANGQRLLDRDPDASPYAGVVEDEDFASASLWFTDALRHGGGPAVEELYRVRAGTYLRRLPKISQVWLADDVGENVAFAGDRMLVTFAEGDTVFEQRVRSFDLSTGGAIGRSPSLENFSCEHLNPTGPVVSPAGNRAILCKTVIDIASGTDLWGKSGTDLRDEDATLSFAPDGENVLVVMADAASLRRAHDGAVVGGPWHHQGIRKAFAGPRGLVASCNGEDIRVWKASSDTEAPAAGPWPCEPDGAGSDLRFSPSGRFVLAITDVGEEARTKAYLALEDRFTNLEEDFPLDPPSDELADTLDAIAHAIDDDLKSRVTTLRIWDVEDGQLVAGPWEVNGAVLHAALSDEGELRTISHGAQVIAQTWSVTDRDEVIDRRCTTGVEDDAKVFFSPSGYRVVVAERNRRPRLANVSSLTPRYETCAVPASGLEAGGRLPDTSAVFSPDERLVAFFGHDEAVRIVDADTGRLVVPPMLHESLPDSVQFHVDGHQLLSTTTEGVIRLWDIVGCGAESEIVHPGAALRASLNRDGSKVVTCNSEGRSLPEMVSIRVWEVSTGKALGTPISAQPPAHGRWDVSFVGDGKTQVAIREGREVRGSWDWRTGIELRPPGTADDRGEKPSLTPHVVEMIARGAGAEIVDGPVVSDDGRKVLTVHRSAKGQWARLSDAATGLPIVERFPPVSVRGIEQKAETIRNAAFSRDGKKLVMQHGKKLVMPHKVRGYIVTVVWDSGTGRQITAFDGKRLAPEPDRVFFPPQFFDDGSRVIAPDRGKIMLFDSGTGQASCLPMTTQDPNQHFDDYSLEHGERLLFAWTATGVRGWETATGHPVTPWYDLKRPEEYYRLRDEPDYNADARRLLVTRGPDTAAVWDLSPDTRDVDEIERAAELLSGRARNRNGELVALEPAEYFARWQAYAKGPRFATAWASQRERGRRLRQVEAAEENGDWWGAARQLERLVVEEGPLDAAGYARKAFAYAMVGEWDRAISDYRRAAEAGGEFPAETERLLALCLLGKGDAAGFRAACGALLSRYGGARDAETLNAVAWTCSLIPDSVDDPARVVGLAEEACRLEPTQLDFANTLGAACVRAGEYDEAIAALNKSADRTSEVELEDHVFLGIAYARTGRMEQGEKHLSAAVEQKTGSRVTAQKVGKGIFSYRVWDWTVLLERTVLRAEARAVLSSISQDDGTRANDGDAPRLD